MAEDFKPLNDPAEIDALVRRWTVISITAAILYAIGVISICIIAFKAGFWWGWAACNVSLLGYVWLSDAVSSEMRQYYPHDEYVDKSLFFYRAHIIRPRWTLLPMTIAQMVFLNIFVIIFWCVGLRGPLLP